MLDSKIVKLAVEDDLSFKASNFKIGSEPISIDLSTKVVFDPSYGRGIFLPEKEFHSAVGALAKVFSQFTDLFSTHFW